MIPPSDLRCINLKNPHRVKSNNSSTIYHITMREILQCNEHFWVRGIFYHALTNYYIILSYYSFSLCREEWVEGTKEQFLQKEKEGKYFNVVFEHLLHLVSCGGAKCSVCLLSLFPSVLLFSLSLAASVSPSLFLSLSESFILFKAHKR